MFEDDEPRESKKESLLPADARAGEKAEELRMHSELAAVFEGPRKFEAAIRAALDPDVARDVQRAVARLEKSKIQQTPVIDAAGMPEAARVLSLPATLGLPTGDYHLYRRPGELMMIRWLAGEEVEAFYARYQAHYDAAIGACRADEHASLEWRGDDKTLAYLKALDAFEMKPVDLYLREPIRRHGLYVLSITAADEMNIRFLSEHLMGASVADLVGAAAVPDEDSGDAGLAWFFKLFALRGTVDGEERMCFFTYMQKSDDDFE